MLPFTAQQYADALKFRAAIRAPLVRTAAAPKAATTETVAAAEATLTGPTVYGKGRPETARGAILRGVIASRCRGRGDCRLATTFAKLTHASPAYVPDATATV